MFSFIISNTISIIKYNNLQAHVLFKFINIYKIYYTFILFEVTVPLHGR
jgi:hypothetical protein